MNPSLVTIRCPDRDTWSGFYVGNVAADAIPLLVAHLDHCSTCRDVLNVLACETANEDDALVAGLRAASVNADAYEREPECRRAVERARALVPAAADARAAVPVPERLGEYRTLQLIGRGGMGAVYRAVHVRLGREVALKIVPPERVRPTSAARFQREVAAHGKLDHPNIVRATDAGEADGVAFLVMELVDGIDFDRLVRARGALPVADACELARQAATGLHHLTEHGLVHRDVKPSNLMLTRRGEVKVLDLGLAADSDRDREGTALTDDGEVLGTFDYLAPEQADAARAVDARTDVYSLGCSLYFLLTGSPPYPDPTHATPRSKMLAHTAGPVPQVRHARSEVPADLAAILARMLAKSPEDRFPTSAAVAAALAPFCSGTDLARFLRAAALEPRPHQPNARAAGAGAPTRLSGGRGVRRTRTMAAAVAALVLLLVGGALSAAVKFWLLPPSSPKPTDMPQQTAPSAAGIAPPAPKEETKPVLPVALLGFEERGAGAKELGGKVGDLLFAKLAAKPEFFLVDRADLKKVLDEQSLSLSGAVKSDEAVKVGHLTGAKLLVTGSVVQVDKKVYLGGQGDRDRDGACGRRVGGGCVVRRPGGVGGEAGRRDRRGGYEAG